VGAPGRLAVDGDEIVLVGPHQPDEVLKAAGEQGRIDPVHQVPQSARAGNAIMERAEPAKKIQVVLAPRQYPRSRRSRR
jgi:hypothetical protein